MDMVVERCCGLDVHKDTVVACVRTPGKGGRRDQETRTFGTMTADLLALRDWLCAMDVTLCGMESTGIYWKCVVRHEAPLTVRGERTPPLGCRSSPTEAGGSLTLETQGRVGAAPTTTGRVGTARRPGSGKQDGKVYELQEPVVEPPQGQNRLQSGGYGPDSSARPGECLGGDSVLPRSCVGKEAMGKACGVPVAMLQGKSWAPHPSNRSAVNVGTILGSPSLRPARSVAGRLVVSR